MIHTVECENFWSNAKTSCDSSNRYARRMANYLKFFQIVGWDIFRSRHRFDCVVRVIEEYVDYSVNKSGHQ